MTKNWKTTLMGAVAAFAGFVLFSPQYFPPWAVDAAKYVMAGGLLGLGVAGKDFTTHSTLAEIQPPKQEAPK